MISMIKNVLITLDNFTILSEMTKVEILIMKELFKYLSHSGDYKDVVILNSSIRRTIIDELNIKSSSFNNSLNNLCKKNVINRLDTNMYTINQQIFKY